MFKHKTYFERDLRILWREGKARDWTDVLPWHERRDDGLYAAELSADEKRMMAPADAALAEGEALHRAALPFPFKREEFVAFCKASNASFFAELIECEFGHAILNERPADAGEAAEWERTRAQQSERLAALERLNPPSYELALAWLEAVAGKTAVTASRPSAEREPMEARETRRLARFREFGGAGKRKGEPKRKRDKNWYLDRGADGALQRLVDEEQGKTAADRSDVSRDLCCALEREWVASQRTV